MLEVHDRTHKVSSKEKAMESKKGINLGILIGFLSAMLGFSAALIIIKKANAQQGVTSIMPLCIGGVKYYSIGFFGTKELSVVPAYNVNGTLKSC